MLLGLSETELKSQPPWLPTSSNLSGVVVSVSLPFLLIIVFLPPTFIFVVRPCWYGIVLGWFAPPLPLDVLLLGTCKSSFIVFWYAGSKISLVYGISLMSNVDSFTFLGGHNYLILEEDTIDIFR